MCFLNVFPRVTFQYAIMLILFQVKGELSAAREVFVKGISRAPQCKLLFEVILFISLSPSVPFLLSGILMFI